jgi:hypothetical protein
MAVMRKEENKTHDNYNPGATSLNGGEVKVYITHPPGALQQLGRRVTVQTASLDLLTLH